MKEGYLIFTTHDRDEITILFIPKSSNATKFFKSLKTSGDNGEGSDKPLSWLNLLDVAGSFYKNDMAEEVEGNWPDDIEMMNSIKDWSFAKEVEEYWIQAYQNSGKWNLSDKKILDSYYMLVY